MQDSREGTPIAGRHPHSPDVYERETLDNGFSRGWGRQFLPIEQYWFDIHTHYAQSNSADISALLQRFRTEVASYNVKRFLIIPPVLHLGEGGGSVDTSGFSVSDENPWYTRSSIVDNAQQMIYLNYLQPDAQFVRQAIKNGICGLKLHNAQVISEGADPSVWLSEEWEKVFEILKECKVPVLWHVTQRLSASPYTDGGRNTYWNEGWQKGVKYTNEDLLRVFLEVVGKYPGIPFISAHQLHLGWDRLGELFDRYENLSTDTSVGCFVRQDDQLYEEDREYLRDVFIRFSDRILFATDAVISEVPSYLWNTYGGHIRFIKQLRLPDEVLQRISHENAEAIFGRSQSK